MLVELVLHLAQQRLLMVLKVVQHFHDVVVGIVHFIPQLFDLGVLLADELLDIPQVEPF